MDFVCGHDEVGQSLAAMPWKMKLEAISSVDLPAKNRRTLMSLIVLALSIVLSAPVHAQDAAFSRDQARLVLREAFSAIVDRHLEPSTPADLLVWSARGLMATDTAFSMRITNGAVHVYYGERLLITRPLPPQRSAQSASFIAAAAAEIGAAADHLADIYAAAWAVSLPVRLRGAERVLQAGFEEVFNHLDPYSRYVTASEALQARQRRVGQAGLGLRIAGGPRNSVSVVAVLPGTSAAETGIREGDRLLAINGAAVDGDDITRVAERLEGPPGSEVQLSLQRGQHRFSATLKRPGAIADSLQSEVREGVLWIRLGLFTSTTTDQIAQLMDASMAGPTPPSGLVLDLRGNRGGILQQAMGVADSFLAGGMVARSQGRHPAAQRVWRAGGGDLLQGRPIIILVDGRTASAAEIVAAALSDRGRAVVVGSSTLGKGLIQIVVPLANEAEILISWSRVLAPRGWPVQGLGVIPELCTSLGSETLQRDLRQLEQGIAPMGPVLERVRRSRPPVPVSEVAALRSACPPAEGRDVDLGAARTLLADQRAYEAALAK